MDIGDDVSIALFAEVSVVFIGLYRLAVTEVVFACYEKAMLIEVLRKAVISVDEFYHAVDDLEDGLRLAIRLPYYRVDLCLAVCRRIVDIFLVHFLSFLAGFAPWN